MSSIRDSFDRGGWDRLEHILARAAENRTSGTLHVMGRPGGWLCLRGGMVLLVESSGSPGVEARLVRTGRVSDEHDPSYEAPRPGGRVGEAELQVVRMMATHDALFAILAGSMEDCLLGVDPHGSHASLAPGEEGPAMVRTAVRRLEALAALQQAILPHRDRFTPVQKAGERELSEARSSILQLADGRRTARDIAFLTGRSVYGVAIDVSHMLAEGLLGAAPPAAEAPQVGRPLARREAEPPAPEQPGDQELPRRKRGASGVNEYIDRHAQVAGWKGFLRFGGRAGGGWL